MKENITIQVPARIEESFIEINETNFGKDHPAYRKFTIDGGIPSEMLDDKLVEAIAGKLGLHMQAICKIV